MLLRHILVMNRDKKVKQIDETSNECKTMVLKVMIQWLLVCNSEQCLSIPKGLTYSTLHLINVATEYGCCFLFFVF